MRSTSTFPPFGVALAVMAAVGGCSTVKDISPFTSNIPYAQDIKPNMPQPAVVEVPAFKPAPKPPAATKPQEAEKSDSEATPGAAPTPSADAAASAPPTPAETAPPPAAPQAAPAPAAAPAASASSSPAAAPTPSETGTSASSAASAPAPAAAAPPTADQSPAPRAAPSGSQSSVAPPAPKVAGSRKPQAAPADNASDEGPPTIPEERRAFNDDGRYPNLAQVPPRPVNAPTFAEAGAIEKTLKAEQAVAKAERPASPAAPSPDSTPAPQQVAAADEQKPVVPANGVVARLEDRAPCLDEAPTGGNPTATVHFKAGTAALASDDYAALAEVMPTVRATTGTIRVFGHGDTDAGSPQGASRFDLAAARADAVAQALIGFGIAATRIAVGVACADNAAAGASAQLYAPS